MNGKLYGVGVGPGDPELMTLKAVKVIKNCDIVVVPGAVAKETVAYKIALGACPFLPEKEIVPIHMPMTKDSKLRAESHQNATQVVEDLLLQGKSVAFLTLGDPTIYSTYIYVHNRIVNKGYQAEIINGIPSFCAVSAKMNIGLVEKEEMLHVIPASYEIDEALEFHGTKVLMKAASKMKDVREKIKEKNQEAVMVENCGMPNEKIYHSTDEIPDKSSYYSLIIIK
ncbi:MAG: precorrin-2 C(20)-methyltransferase [Clostridia bacterium]